jgi:hypothetical protein
MLTSISLVIFATRHTTASNSIMQNEKQSAPVKK